MEIHDQYSTNGLLLQESDKRFADAGAVFTGMTKGVRVAEKPQMLYNASKPKPAKEGEQK